MLPIARLLLPMALLAFGLLAAGCGKAYVNDDIVDPSEARQRLAADKALCRQMANEYVPPTYGINRFSYDPTIEAQAGNYVNNVIEDDDHASVFDACMRNRGWRYK